MKVARIQLEFQKDLLLSAKWLTSSGSLEEQVKGKLVC